MILLLSRLRVALSLAGSAAVVIGLMQDNRTIIWVAIGLMSGSVAARLALRRMLRGEGRGEEESNG